MAVNNAKPLLSVSAQLFHVSRRQLGGQSFGSRINKYKKPFVGGIYKVIQKPLSPREDEEHAAEGESLYPEIKGEYPPGDWGKMDVGRAWKFHARGQELLEIGSLRDRLYDLTKVRKRWVEKIESKEKMKHWTILASRERPYFFPFLQYVTKTRLLLTLPEEMLRSNPKINHARLKQRVNEKVCLLSAQEASARNRVAAIVEAVSSELLANDRVTHLVEGQMEENVTFKAAWRRCGYEEADMENEVAKTKNWSKSMGTYVPVGGYEHLDPGILNFQGIATPFLSLRSQFPLQVDKATSKTVVADKAKVGAEVEETKLAAIEKSTDQDADQDVSLPSFVHDWVINDQNSIPLYAYHPSFYGLKNFIEPPKLNAGFALQPVKSRTWVEAQRDKFWVEKPQSWNAISDRSALRRVITHHTIEAHPGVESDPRGFPHTAFCLPTNGEGVDALGYEADVEPMQLQQWDAEQMLTTLFTWNVAAAHYQGFCSYLDLTYPIASQGVLTDGHSWQFYVLQTDTIQVWRDDDDYAKGSSMWMSRKMNMDEDADLIINVLTNVLAKETSKMSNKQLQPYVTKSDEVREVVKDKYNFGMKVL